MANQTLARALFTPSLAVSRTLLQTTIWDEPFAVHISDTLVLAAVARNDDVDYIRRILADGTLARHPRINTLELLVAFVTASAGANPLPLRVVMENTDRALLERSHGSAAAQLVPRSTEEHQMAQLEQARDMLLAQRDMDMFAEEDEEEDDEMRPRAKEPACGGDDDEGGDQPVMATASLPWPREPRQGSRYSWWRTVWSRVNLGGHAMISGCRNVTLEHKRARFRNAHLAVIQYLDSLDDPCDDAIDVPRLLALYGDGLGPSTYTDDDDQQGGGYAEVVSVRETPLEIIARHVPPEEMWSFTVEGVLDALREGCIAADQLSPTIADGDEEWMPVPHATVETHAVYLACIYVMNRVRRLGGERMGERTGEHTPHTPHTPTLSDACHAYYAAFVDLFAAGLVVEQPHDPMSDAWLLTPAGSTRTRTGRMLMNDDALSPWERHAGVTLPERAFCAGDLPDLFHVLTVIPLWGEQHTPPFRIGKIYQKSLPFACQRRHLIRLIVATIESDDAFWRVFSRLMWVMLADLYPRTSGDDDLSRSTFRHLLRARELTASKEAMCDALRGPAGGVSANGAPLVVFVAFRLHILYMASFNRSTYVEGAAKCIDWDYFEQNTLELARLIRESSLFSAEDPFAQARAQLSRTVKNPSARIHRFRNHSEAMTVADQMNRIERAIIADRHARSPPDTRISYYDSLFRTAARFKSPIINLLIRLPPHDRMTLRAFLTLTLPEYGGISDASAQAMARMTHIYFDNAVPKEFRECITGMEPHDFIVATFYFNMVAALQSIVFVPLDAETVRRTDRAMMTRRYHLYPGQALPPDVYNVSVALCCGKVRSLMGNGKYGAKKVAYDIEKRAFICVRNGRSGHKEEDVDDEDDDDDEGNDAEERDGIAGIFAAQDARVEDFSGLIRPSMRSLAHLGASDLVSDAATKRGRGTQRAAEMETRKAVRNERKAYNKIPCGQPVLTFSLRGRALVWGTTLDNRQQYMFCPECGVLHAYTALNFSGAPAGLYRCNECARKDPTCASYLRCAYCGRDSHTHAALMSDAYWLTICDPLPDPHTAHTAYYFCRTHYNIARRFAHRKMRAEVWENIRVVEHRKMMDAAQKY